MLCILYVTAVGTLLGAAGLLVERVLPTAAARRGVWCLIIPTSVALPGIYRAKHAWPVTFQPDLWACTESFDTTINRLWLIASGLLVIWGLTNAMRVWDVVSSSRARRGDRRKPTIVDGVPVIVTDLAGPATVGLWRSLVLVPRWVLALPGTQRQYVLRHEDEHRRAHDSLLLFVASLPLLLMPWNLAMWWQLRRLSLAVEMDCDNRVVAALGDANAYGHLLFKVAQAANRDPRLQPALLGVRGSGTLERRLTKLLAPTPLRHAQRFLLAAAVMGLLLVVLWMPHPIVPPGHAHVAMASR
jgi:bla regulator protein BlaR1